MPEFQRSAKLMTAVGSINTGSVFWPARPLDVGGTVQFGGTTNSFNAKLQGTNFFDAGVGVGSFWVDVISAAVGPRTATFSGRYAAFRMQVNSVTSGSFVSGVGNFS